MNSSCRLAVIIVTILRSLAGLVTAANAGAECPSVLRSPEVQFQARYAIMSLSGRAFSDPGTAFKQFLAELVAAPTVLNQPALARQILSLSSLDIEACFPEFKAALPGLSRLVEQRATKDAEKQRMLTEQQAQLQKDAQQRATRAEQAQKQLGGNAICDPGWQICIMLGKMFIANDRLRSAVQPLAISNISKDTLKYVTLRCFFEDENGQPAGGSGHYIASSGVSYLRPDETLETQAVAPLASTAVRAKCKIHDVAVDH